MEIIDTEISGLLVLKPRLFGDDRGFFLESFNQKDFCDAVGREVHFVQDNHSRSAKGVLRGLHYQLAPYSQGKLVRVVAGDVFDVAVDLRRESKTFGKWFGINLSASNGCQLWIPEGFAHGFLVMSDYADFLYKTTAYWNASAERSIRYDCPSIGIDWPSVDGLLLSPKDAAAKTLLEADL